METYVVLFRWYDELNDKHIKPDNRYVFQYADDALDFIDKVVWRSSKYQEYGEPLDIYLYKFNEYETIDNEDKRYIAAWHEVDKRVRDRW